MFKRTYWLIGVLKKKKLRSFEKDYHIKLLLLQCEKSPVVCINLLSCVELCLKWIRIYCEQNVQANVNEEGYVTEKWFKI